MPSTQMNPYRWKRMTDDIWRRDNGICHLCLKPVDNSLPGNTPWGPSLDHIVTRKDGGTEASSNLRLAHHACNSERRDRSIAECVGTDDRRKLFIEQTEHNVKALELKAKAKQLAKTKPKEIYAPTQAAAGNAQRLFKRGTDYPPYNGLTGALRPEESKVQLQIAMPPRHEQPYDDQTGKRRAGVEWPPGSADYGL